MELLALLILLPLIVLATIAGDYEKVERRKNYDAGTHDYYGNKLNDDEL